MTHIVRRALPTEYHKYRAHLHALGESSRIMRFGFAITDETLDKLCDGFAESPENHILFCIENSDLEFVAIGHIAIDGTDDMELAFSVLDQYQGQGMGSILMRRCIQWCRTHNILKGYMVCLSHNAAIRRLCTKHGIQFHSSHGETEASIKLSSPNFGTYLKEVTDSNLGLLDYVNKRANILSWSFAN